MNPNTNPSAINAVFVYGTLKTGQCRADLWPRNPLSIEVAWVRGRLHGRADYPAMTQGVDRVRGELWRFASDAMPEVLDRLDEIEGTHQLGEANLYHRIEIDVFNAQGEPLTRAYAYLFATDPGRSGFYPIRSAGGEASWPEPI